MKKIALLALTMIMVLTAVCPAFAAGKLVVNQEKFYSIEPYENSFYTYVFAEVTNTGDKPVEYNNGLWEIYDANGDTLDSRDYMNCCPSVLQPGEIGYVYTNLSMDNIESAEEAADYLLTVSGKSANESTIVRMPATVKYTYVPSEYGRDNHLLTATVTNDTNDVMYDFRVVFAVKDAEGNLLYVNEEPVYDVGILPGTSLEVRMDVSYENVVQYLLEQDALHFDMVEVIAYADIDD